MLRLAGLQLPTLSSFAARKCEIASSFQAERSLCSSNFGRRYYRGDGQEREIGALPEAAASERRPPEDK